MLRTTFYSALSFILFVQCQNATSSKKATSEDSSMKAEEQAWMDLSPKDSFDGWHIYQNEDGTKTGWTVAEGVFTYNSADASGEGNKSLLTNATFGSFEIQFEWKLSPESNSGFMWGVSEDPMYEHPFVTGPEIQIIDTQVYGDDPEHQVHTAGALYDMVPPDHLMAKPAGEWNSYHITINHETNLGTVVHNGMEINRFPLHGSEWDTMVANSKFSTMEGFGKYTEGHLSLQDHPGIISFRNIKIKKL